MQLLEDANAKVGALDTVLHLTAVFSPEIVFKDEGGINELYIINICLSVAIVSALVHFSMGRSWETFLHLSGQLSCSLIGEACIYTDYNTEVYSGLFL